jgi:hypothetical protein
MSLSRSKIIVEASVGSAAYQINPQDDRTRTDIGLFAHLAATGQNPAAKHSRHSWPLQQRVSVFLILAQVFGEAIRKREKMTEDTLILQVARAPQGEAIGCSCKPVPSVSNFRRDYPIFPGFAIGRFRDLGIRRTRTVQDARPDGLSFRTTTFCG